MEPLHIKGYAGLIFDHSCFHFPKFILLHVVSIQQHVLYGDFFVLMFLTPYSTHLRLCFVRVLSSIFRSYHDHALHSLSVYVSSIMPVHTQNHKPAKTAFVNKDEFDMDIDAMDDGDDKCGYASSPQSTTNSDMFLTRRIAWQIC